MQDDQLNQQDIQFHRVKRFIRSICTAQDSAQYWHLLLTYGNLGLYMY
jgi:hypothetical protein